MSNNTDKRLLDAIFGVGYQIGLPELPDNPDGGHYYWTRYVKGSPNGADEIHIDAQGNKWIVDFRWEY